jgi:hypothetical protein
VFDVQVYYLDELDSQAVRVELYANGVTGTAAERVAMQCLRQLVGASKGYADRTGVPAGRRGRRVENPEEATSGAAWPGLNHVVPVVVFITGLVFADNLLTVVEIFVRSLSSQDVNTDP